MPYNKVQNITEGDVFNLRFTTAAGQEIPSTLLPGLQTINWPPDADQLIWRLGDNGVQNIVQKIAGEGLLTIQ